MFPAADIVLHCFFGVAWFGGIPYANVENAVAARKYRLGTLLDFYMADLFGPDLVEIDLHTSAGGLSTFLF